MSLINAEPGSSESEILTIQNTSGAAFTLSLQAVGSSNPLWDELELAVWQLGTAPPDPFPQLTWWAAQDNTLQTLQANQTVRYEVELYLPTSAGNEVQGPSAAVNLKWSAQA